jgi:pimeloyl-ACP methyl ester carboxylesterase
MTYAGDGRLPVIYVRGYAGGPSGIDKAVDDPFYGFNEGSVQVRVDGSDRPVFHQFESPLLRLLMDHGYQLIVQGDQLAYLQAQPAQSVPAATIWVHRFYDEFAPGLTKDPNAFSIERAAQSLVDLILLVRKQTGAPRVFLVAHSMGGLVVRAAVQKTIPDSPTLGGTLDAARAFVDRIFTYATPHGGIDFALGGGLLEKLRDALNPSGANIFGPERMAEYLTPALAGPPPSSGFEATVMPRDGFPLDRLFCLVGTDAQDYAVGHGIPAKAVGPRSDGLVQFDDAAVQGAPRALVHRSHSGPYGIVNSEEGYQNLRRFLFGDISVTASLTDLQLPGTPDDGVDWQLETALSIRGLPVVLHEQSTAYLCPIQVERPATADTPATPVPLVQTYLSTAARRPTDAEGVPAPTMRHVLRLRLLSLQRRGGFLSFVDHLEQTADWADVLVVDIQATSAQPHAWAVWHSSMSTAISQWAPDPAKDAPLTDEDAAAGVWRARVPVPQNARGLLGPDAAITLEVRPRATVDVSEHAAAGTAAGGASLAGGPGSPV